MPTGIYKRTKKHCENISKSLKGIEHSDKMKKNMSISMKGKISHRKGKNISDETKLKISKSLKGRASPFKGMKQSDKFMQSLHNRIMPYRDSKLEKMLQAFLISESILFDKHWSPKELINQKYYHRYDLHIKDINLLIEIDGCYWHGCKKCGFQDLEKTKRDKRQNYMAKKIGYKVIRFWGHDILNDFPKVMRKFYKHFNYSSKEVK